MEFLIGSYPRLCKDARGQRIDNLEDTTSGILDDQAIFDNNLETIQLHREDYDAKTEREWGYSSKGWWRP